MINKLKERIAYMEQEGYEMGQASWGDEEGIVITGNEAKLIIELYKAADLIRRDINLSIENGSSVRMVSRGRSIKLFEILEKIENHG